MRTPIAQVRGLGSAKKGTGEFILQRLTAVALAILMTIFVILIVALSGAPYDRVIAVLGSPLVAIVLLGAVLAATVHMRIGMQVIIEDYVHQESAKFALLTANWLFTWAVALAAGFAVLKIAFGGA